MRGEVRGGGGPRSGASVPAGGVETSDQTAERRQALFSAHHLSSPPLLLDTSQSHCSISQGEHHLNIQLDTALALERRISIS